MEQAAQIQYTEKLVILICYLIILAFRSRSNYLNGKIVWRTCDMSNTGSEANVFVRIVQYLWIKINCTSISKVSTKAGDQCYHYIQVCN
jgi:hypothetical protein